MHCVRREMYIPSVVMGMPFIPNIFETNRNQIIQNLPHPVVSHGKEIKRVFQW